MYGSLLRSHSRQEKGLDQVVHERDDHPGSERSVGKQDGDAALQENCATMLSSGLMYHNEAEGRKKLLLVNYEQDSAVGESSWSCVDPQFRSCAVVNDLGTG